VPSREPAPRALPVLVLVLVLVLVAVLESAAHAADSFAWTPTDSASVARGRDVARRFDLTNLVELTVEVDNAYSAANRAALGAAEQRLATLPGVRRVVGPAALLDVTVDVSGKPSARSVLARGATEDDGEAARQRVVRRADALGWFVSANGRLVRFLIDAEDLGRVRGQLAAALSTAGLSLAQAPEGGGIGLRALLPDPRARGARWLPAALTGAWVLFIVIVGFKARPLTGRFSRLGGAAVALGAAIGAMAPTALVPVGGVRLAGAAAAAAAAGAVLLGLAFERGRGPRKGGWNRFARPPVLVTLLALASIGTFAAVATRLHVGTHQWSEAPLAFVDVRADFDQPAVLREVQRLTEFLRAQPGVESAWSVADLFMGVETEGEEASHVPADVEDVRHILVQARSDPAVGLELSADHREGLVVVRFDEGAEGPTDRLDLVDKLALYLTTELRSWLIPVDLRAPALGAVTRGVAKGLLASDTYQRVVGICARSGRPLTATEARAVDRVARQAAAIPTADPGRLPGEIAEETRDFATHHPVPLREAELTKLVDAIVALPDDASVTDVSWILATTYGERMSARVLADSAAILARRLAAVRWRHTARINFHEMLYGADLPTEGVLADEVKSATLEGMGPVIGLPVAPGTSSAQHLDVATVGGAANDRALSDAWSDGLRWGGVGLAAAWAGLLVLVGRARGLAWLPLGLGPGAAALIAPALVHEPVGLWSLAFVSGALAAGGVVALAFAAPRVAT
jgi:hypothetical protein